jgi:hypothetical protein
MARTASLTWWWGADGVGSAVRAVIYPGIEPAYR